MPCTRKRMLQLRKKQPFFEMLFEKIKAAKQPNASQVLRFTSSKQRWRQQRRHIHTSLNSIMNKPNKHPTCKLKINNTWTEILIDSGASINLLDGKALKALKPTPTLQPTSVKIFPYKSTNPENTRSYQLKRWHTSLWKDTIGTRPSTWRHLSTTQRKWPNP